MSPTKIKFNKQQKKVESAKKTQNIRQFYVNLRIKSNNEASNYKLWV